MNQLYKICALFEPAMWCTLFHNGGCVYAGYIENIPGKYTKYPVYKIRALGYNHVIIEIV